MYTVGFKDRLEKANAAAREAGRGDASNAEDKQRREAEKLAARRAKNDSRAASQADRPKLFPEPAPKRNPPKPKQPRGRQKISEAGATEDGIRCPSCGGSQFTAKRSMKAKTLGVATVGVGAALAPKSQVKCVTCGAMYKRG